MTPLQAVENLVSIMNDRTQSTEVRAGAAQGLGHTGRPEARAALAILMSERTQSVEVRAAAAEALGRAASPSGFA